MAIAIRSAWILSASGYVEVDAGAITIAANETQGPLLDSLGFTAPAPGKMTFTVEAVAEEPFPCMALERPRRPK